MWFVGYVTALMTAFYMFRLIYLTFFSKPRMSHDVEHHIHESPASMTMPLVVLAVMSLFAGFLGWPHSLGGSDHFARYLDPVFSRGEANVLVEQGRASQVAAGEKEEEHTSPTEYLLMFLSVAAARLGLVHGRPRLCERGQGIYRADREGVSASLQRVTAQVLRRRRI